MSIKIENASKTISDEAVAKLQEELNKTNEVLKEITLRKGETDVRQLSDADFKQAQYRYMNDSLTLLNSINHTLLDINLILFESLSQNKKTKVANLLNKVKSDVSPDNKA